MKKIKFFGLVILLVCVMVLSGCTKAGNAKIETCNILYEKVTKNYYKDERTEKIRIFDEEGNVDLYSIGSWEYPNAKNPTDKTKLYNYIFSVDTEGSMYTFNVLREGGEYAVLIKAVSDFYLLNNKSTHSTTDENVPQEIKSELYDRIDELAGVLEKVKSSKDNLMSMIDNFNYSVDAIPVQKALDTFLKSYKSLIEKFYEISSIYEDIYTNYLFVVDTKTLVPIGGMERLVRGSEIYLAKYYYLKHLVLNAGDDRFSFRKIYNAETSAFVDNPNYDDSFEKLAEMVDTAIAEIALPREDEPDYEEALAIYNSKLYYYNCCLEKFETLKTNIRNYETAVNYIAGLKGKTEGNKIAQEYLKFMAKFEQQVLDYEQYLLTNIIV